MIGWVLGIVSVLGIGGTIAALIFFPAVVIPILQSIVSAILRCKPCLYAIAIMALMAGSGWYGHHKAVLACQAAELEAVVRNQRIDIENANKAAADEANRAIEIEVNASEQRKHDAEYIASLKAKPACLLDDDDIGLPNHKSGASSKKPATRTK